MNRSILLKDAHETLELGRAIARSLKKPCLIYLHGELGAGKTTLAQGLIKELLGETRVLSPTYSYVQSYGENTIHHFDLYRIDDPEIVMELGLDTLLADETAIRLVEWPENLGYLYHKPDIDIHLIKEGHRLAIINDELLA